MELQSRPFGVTRDGQAVTCYTLVSDNGCTAEILDYGATIRAITVPDRDGRAVDVALGYDTLAEYQKNSGSMGATVGRFANRIAKGRFTLNGVEYQLAVNNGPNHLHGGLLGFERQVWQAEETAEGLRFTLVSPDGQDGYPGAMTVSVTFSWAGSALTLRYRAVSDKDTVLNLTNHCYFNLDGQGKILDHTLTVAAETFNEGDPDCLPTGRLLPVAGTAMDFRTPRPIGEAVDSDEACVKLSGGYDSNFVLSGARVKARRARRQQRQSCRRAPQRQERHCHDGHHRPARRAGLFLQLPHRPQGQERRQLRPAQRPVPGDPALPRRHPPSRVAQLHPQSRGHLRELYHLRLLGGVTPNGRPRAARFPYYAKPAIDPFVGAGFMPARAAPPEPPGLRSSRPGHGGMWACRPTGFDGGAAGNATLSGRP